MFTLAQAKEYFKKNNFWNPKYSIKQIKESTNNTIFSHNKLILKQYTHKENYLFEKQCLQAISLKNKKYFSTIILDDTQRHIMIFNKLPWKTLDKIRPDLSSKQQSLYIGKLINILQELHTIQAPVWYKFSYYLKNGIEKYYSKAVKNPYIQKQKFKSLYLYIIKHLSLFSKQKQVFIHSDFWVKNILANKNNITGIIDFETWCYGPLCIEWYNIQHTWFYIKDWGDDTSPAEQDFMKKFIIKIKKTYPNLFVSTQQQDKIYHGIHYIKKLSRWKEKRYIQEDVEKFKKEFL